MEMPEVNIEDFQKWKMNQAIVKEFDMDEEILNEAKEFVIDGIEKASGGHGIAIDAACKYAKEKMDNKFGPTWHCIMGEGFSFELTRFRKSTLYMYYAGKIGVLLFKC